MDQLHDEINRLVRHLQELRPSNDERRIASSELERVTGLAVTDPRRPGARYYGDTHWGFALFGPAEISVGSYCNDIRIRGTSSAGASVMIKIPIKAVGALIAELERLRNPKERSRPGSPSETVIHTRGGRAPTAKPIIQGADELASRLDVYAPGDYAPFNGGVIA